MKKFLLFIFVLLTLSSNFLLGQQTQKPVLHGKNWMAITGKPLAATAGAMIFQQEGYAVNASRAIFAATSTMWDVLSWCGETQALIYGPNTNKVIAINALGVAPGATAAFFKGKGMKALMDMGYTLQFEHNLRAVNAIYFDRQHNSFRGGSSNYCDDYGIGW